MNTIIDLYNGAGESVLFKEIIMFYFKMNFSKMYTDLILKYADDYKPSTYNTKYSNRYYLERLQIKNQRFLICSPTLSKKSKIFLIMNIFLQF